MDPKVAFVQDVKRGKKVEDACRDHGVSRSCGYKTLARFDEHGVAGLEELSRAPHHCPRQTPEEAVQTLLGLKEQFPHYGPVTLVNMIEMETGEHFLASSTAGEILARHGKVNRRRRRPRGAGPIEHPPFTIDGPGHSMTMDYKGQFRMGNRQWCYPLTVAEPVSRYIFAIEALPSTATALAKPVFEKVFRQNGVPVQIISDNGTPFASRRSLGGLTELSKWLIQQGSTPVRIEPGHPEQNGIHERMHRTLKERITAWPQPDLRHQQQFFERVQNELNHIRPHRALGKATPGSVLKPYPKPYIEKVPVMDYDEAFITRTVRSNGQIKWNGGLVFLSEVLVDDRVGLAQLSDSVWEIYYGHIRIGYLDEATMKATNSRPEQRPAASEPNEDEEN